MDRDGHGLLHRLGLDLNARTHTRSNLSIRMQGLNTYLKICDLLLRALVLHGGRTGDPFYLTVKFMPSIGINSNPDRVTNPDVHYIVFIHGHPSLDNVQVCYPHDLSTGEISRPHYTLTQLD